MQKFYYQGGQWWGRFQPPFRTPLAGKEPSVGERGQFKSRLSFLVGGSCRETSKHLLGSGRAINRKYL